ncbi:MAG: nitronate monooxygenase [Bacillus sp. (in: firmicutes)]
MGIHTLDTLTYPIVQAPMAGGIANPKLASSVSNAGGLGFLAAGDKSPDMVREEIAETRLLTDRPFGVNLFVPADENIDEQAVEEYEEKLKDLAEQIGVSLGAAVYDDDGWEEKIAVVLEEKVPVASFTFGCPSVDVVQSLKKQNIYVIISVTNKQEALMAEQAGADALCVQGIEAGGHRAAFYNGDSKVEEFPLLEALRQVKSCSEVPLIGAGGIMDPDAAEAALQAGAVAVQVGTALLLCPESGTNRQHRQALKDSAFHATMLTRAFTGRRARGLVNDFAIRFSGEAPAAYPHIHRMTQPLRKTGIPGYMSFWAGIGFKQCKELPAAMIIRLLAGMGRQ